METYTPPRVTLNEALSWFDEDELRQLQKDMTDNMVTELKAVPKANHKPRELAKYEMIEDPDTGKQVNALTWVSRGVYEYKVKQIMEHYSRLGKRIKGRLYQFDFPEGPANGVSDAQIENAREYPIQDLFTELVNTPIRGDMAKCPFHPDKTASLSLRRHNRFHCFGCDAKGDTIAFYMKINGVDFMTAVDYLSTGAQR
jgi:hypothetical protein